MPDYQDMRMRENLAARAEPVPSNSPATEHHDIRHELVALINMIREKRMDSLMSICEFSGMSNREILMVLMYEGKSLVQNLQHRIDSYDKAMSMSGAHTSRVER